MTYWARWLIELGDLSSSVTYRARFFKRRKKEKRILLIHQHGLRFIVLKHQHGRQTSCENAQNFKYTKTRLRLEKLGNLDKLGEHFKCKWFEKNCQMIFRAAVCNYREFAVETEISKFFIFSLKKPFGEKFSQSKFPKNFLFRENRPK